MQASPLLSLSPSSPSFNSYSSANLAEIAARVVEEFRKESDLDSSIYEWETESLFSEEREQEDTFCDKNLQDSNKNHEDEDEEEEEDEEEFEFAVVCRRPDSPISADEIFFNGQIRPIYPVFDTSLLLNDTHINQNAENNSSSTSSSSSSSKTSSRSPLRKLMSEERDTTTSCSSSEADDLDNLHPGTYCVWTPKANSRHQDSPGRSCKKSNSTGSSKRWKFRDLLYRSNSDGKDTFVFLAPNKKTTDQKVSAEDSSKENKGKVKVVEEHYVKNHRATKEEDKRKSFLPYRQDLVGFFNNVNGLSRNLHPF